MQVRHMSNLHNRGNGGFEREDLGSKPIIGFVVSVVVGGVLIYYVLWGMLHFMDAYERKQQQSVSPLVNAEQDTRDADRQTTARKVQEQFPEPRLEDNERTELNDFRYSEEEKLNSSGWVDQSAGVAHIPITQAMQLIAQRGLPTTPQAGPPPPSIVNTGREAAVKSDISSSPKNAAKKKRK
jgi:hypothetical protein